MRPILYLSIALIASCGMSSGPKPDLKPASELKHNCIAPPYSKKNRVTLGVNFERGDQAIDFTLKDRNGRSHTLSKMLQEKPVLLMTGSYTCPRFQGTLAATKALATKYGDDIHTAVVYVPEAHPKKDANPYSGKHKPKGFSDRPQQKTYPERVRAAEDIDIGTDALVLIDDLAKDNTNPFWCTYGTCPSCSFLIRQDGTIEAVHLWHDPDSMAGSIDALLKSGS